MNAVPDWFPAYAERIEQAHRDGLMPMSAVLCPLCSGAIRINQKDERRTVPYADRQIRVCHCETTRTANESRDVLFPGWTGPTGRYTSGKAAD